MTDTPDQPTKKAHNAERIRGEKAPFILLIPFVISKKPISKTEIVLSSQKNNTRFSTDAETMAKKHTKQQMFIMGRNDDVMASGIFERVKLCFFGAYFSDTLFLGRTNRPTTNADRAWHI